MKSMKTHERTLFLIFIAIISALLAAVLNIYTSVDYLVQDVEPSKKMSLVDYIRKNESHIKNCLADKEAVNIQEISNMKEDGGICYLPKSISVDINKEKLYAIKSVNMIDVYIQNILLLSIPL